MANQFMPFGLQDLVMREGNSPQYGLTKVQISSTDPTPIFNGDLVQNITGGVASGNFGEYITQASSGLSLGVSWYAGVFRGCEFLHTFLGRTVWSPWWPGANAGTDAIAYIERASDMQFLIQVSTQSGVPLGSSNIGQNFQVNTTGIAMTSTIGDKNLGTSGIALASSISGAATSSFALRLKGFFSEYSAGIGIPPSLPLSGPLAPGVVTSFVNGTDNTTPGQIVVVQLNNIGDNQVAGL